MVVDVPFPMDNWLFSVWIRITLAAGASEKVYFFWQVARVCEWNVPGCGIWRQNYAGNVPAAVPWETSVGLGVEVCASLFTPHRAVCLVKQRCELLGNKSSPLCPNGVKWLKVVLWKARGKWNIPYWHKDKVSRLHKTSRIPAACYFSRNNWSTGLKFFTFAVGKILPSVIFCVCIGW